ncbi:hypothetical protein MTO96_008938 [Rhipicephalus appendiculatus]
MRPLPSSTRRPPRPVISTVDGQLATKAAIFKRTLDRIRKMTAKVARLRALFQQAPPAEHNGAVGIERAPPPFCLTGRPQRLPAV